MENRLCTRRHAVLAGGAALIGVAGLACAPSGQGRPATNARALPPQSVELWGPDPSTNPAMSAVVNAFRGQFPNLDLKTTGGALNITPESREKFITATVAGNPPDVTYQDRWIPRSYAVLGAIVYVEDRIKGSRLKPEE